MEYRELGKTGLKVSTIGFGASSLGGVFHSFNEQRGIDAVFAGIDAGINYIDVSPYYGHYKAEPSQTLPCYALIYGTQKLFILWVTHVLFDPR